MFLSHVNETGFIANHENKDVKFEFLLQPIYCPKKCVTEYYEVLSKVHIDENRIYENESFFEAIDDDFIKQIALNQIIYLQKMELDKIFSVNVTLSALADSKFVNTILDLNQVNFALEINEINHDFSDINLINNIKHLQNKGIMLWLDDYRQDDKKINQSLGVIHWDIIKIDKEFLLYNCDDNEAMEALLFILKPFTKNGFIIEGIESAYQNDFIKKYDVLGQGFYYSYPNTHYLGNYGVNKRNDKRKNTDVEYRKLT